jgi:hypothetical protein
MSSPGHRGRRWLLGVIAAALAYGSGCGSRHPARLVAPAIAPEQAATAILARADGNGDGSIDGKEAARLPAIAAVIPDLDTDGDKRLSREELARWLDDVRRARVAINPIGLMLTHQGKPLANARVRLVPDDALGPGVQQAEGTTDAGGLARPMIAGGQYPGVNCGLYKIEITGQGNDGRSLPARFNTATALGLAVGGPLPKNGVVTIRLD